MSIPGFTAESSLGPTLGKYRGNSAFGGLGAVNVTLSQQFRASPIVGQSLEWRFPIWWNLRPAICCGYPSNGRHIECVFQWVPLSYTCLCIQDNVYGGGPHLFCQPAVNP
jgi:hypothetical protein